MHHAFTATDSIALAVAAALPGSIVARNLRKMSSERQPEVVRIDHASGRLAIGATVRHGKSGWQMDKAILSRSARVLMSGWVHV
jgi:2-methylaconitate cis-trans-isomerase PrpF